MRIGDCVVTPYNQEGIVVKLFHETKCCIVEVEGEEQGYNYNDVTPTCFDFEDENMNHGLAMFDPGDLVCIKGDTMVCKVLNVVGIEDDMVWYDIDRSGHLICEEESNLSYVGQKQQAASKSFTSSAKEYKFAVAYKSNSDDIEYYICDINDIKSFLNNKECFYVIKTYVFKTGMSFPGTEKFNSDDIAALKTAQKIPAIEVGSVVWIYMKQKWGTVTGRSYADSFAVLFEDGSSVFADYDEVFIPVRETETSTSCE